MINKLPVYYAEIENDTEGISSIALVDFPAVESDFMTFSKSERKNTLRFMAIEAGEQRLILGVVCRADFPIYRVDDFGDEFYVVFRRDIVRQLAEKMLYDGRTSAVNIMHSTRLVNGVNLNEIFIKDSTKGISPVGFEDIEEGSLFAVYKVHNDDVWDACKRGEFRGFSLEGIFDILPANMEQPASSELDALMAEVEKLEQTINKL